MPLDAEDGFCEQSEGNTETHDVLMSTARTPGTGTRGTYTPAYGYGVVDAQAATATPVTTAQPAPTKGGKKKPR